MTERSFCDFLRHETGRRGGPRSSGRQSLRTSFMSLWSVCGRPRHTWLSRSAALAGRYATTSCSLYDLFWLPLGGVSISSVKEPAGPFRSDGKRHESLTFIHWHSGKSLGYDATVLATPVLSYISTSSASLSWKAPPRFNAVCFKSILIQPEAADF